MTIMKTCPQCGGPFEAENIGGLCDRFVRWTLKKDLSRIIHESAAPTVDMTVLPGVLGCRPLRRTVQVRLGTNTLRLPGGAPILFALAPLRSVPQAGSQLHGLTTQIHE